MDPVIRDEYGLFEKAVERIRLDLHSGARCFAFGSRVRKSGRKNDFDILVYLSPEQFKDILPYSAPHYERIRKSVKGNLKHPANKKKLISRLETAAATDALQRVKTHFKDEIDEFGNPVVMDITVVRAIPKGYPEIGLL